MSRKTALCAFVVCSLACLVGPLLHGQATGSFSGTVTDNSGAVVPNAKVTVTAQETNTSREATTDPTGHYLVPLLGVADYTIRVDAAGFKSAESRNLRLQVDEQRVLDFKLVPAAVSTTVEVNATEVAVETTNPTLGQVITSEEVADLPLNGRDFVQLATLAPGVTQETNPNSFFNGGPSSEVSTRGTFSLSVGGSRAQSTDWVLDGNDNNELSAGGISIIPSIDAIEEFKVLTYNSKAEFGTRAGPTVLLTTKSGTNQFHGSLFEFFRNTRLDARSYFASSKEKFNLNQFGGTFGGPIQKDKTFIFLDYEAKRQRHGIPFVGLIPTQAMMNGDFTLDPFGTPRPGTFDGTFQPNANGFVDLVNPYSGMPFQCDSLGNPIAPNSTTGAQAAGTNCNKIPIATIQNGGMAEAPGLALINLYPQSNTNNAAGGYNYTNVPVRRLNEGKFDVRLDHNLSNKDRIFGRFSYDQATSFVPGGSPGFAEQGAFASTQDITNHGRNAVISETHIFNDRNINQITGGFNRIFNIILSYGNGSCEAQKIGLLGADLNSVCGAQPPGIMNQSTKDCMSCGLSSMQFLTGYWSLGDRGFAPSQGGTNIFSISDSLDMIRGKHEIKTGIGIRAHQLNVRSNAFQDGFILMGNAFGIPGNGTYSGDPEADLILGQVGGAIHDQTYKGATSGRRWKMFRPFVQDDWRATPDLTLNLGLAWSLVTPVTEAQNRQADFNFSTGQYLVAGPVVANCTTCVHTGSRAGIEMDKTALEPRIGFAWKVLGSQKTAVRGAYSIFHDASWSQGDQGLWLNPPYLAESDNFSGLAPFNTLATPTTTCGFLGQGCGLAAAFLPFLPPPLNPDTFQGTRLWQNTNFKQGRVQQFSADIEQQLPGQIVLTAGYAGSRGHHILVSGVNVNVGSPSACGVVTGYTLGCGPGGTALAAPYGAFTIVGNFNDAGNATYNSFQLKAETKSSRHGLYGLVSYTYSHTYDSGMPDNLGTTPGATYWPLPGTIKADWAKSQINLDNQLTASVIYDLPFGKGKAFGNGWSGPVNAAFGGWQATVIEKITSGFPLFVVNSTNGSGVFFQWNGNSLNRPDEVGDPNKAGPEGGRTDCPSQIHTTANWFNPCAFAPAPSGELGTANRAPVTGPDFVNTDFSLIKQIHITERVGLNFRAEFFNLFNHAQFFLQGSSLTAMQDISSPSTFAKVNQTVNNPRLVQFALKLNF